MKVNFYRLESRTDTAPVYLFVSHKGIRKKMGSPIFHISVKDWDKRRQRVKSNLAISMQLNNELNVLEAKVMALNMPRTTWDQIEGLFKPAEQKEAIPFFQEWDTWIIDRSSENTEGTARHRRVTKGKLQQFEKVWGNITTEKITIGFLQAFANFLHAQDYSASTVASHVNKVKHFMSYLEKRDNPKISDFRVKEIQTTKIFLTEKELDVLWAKELKIKEWEISRDLYVLRCDTGLRIGDFKRLGAEHIKNNAIEMQTNKADTITYVPLTARAESILKKYNYSLPLMLEKDQNKFIKVACKVAGIKSKIEKVELRNGKKNHIVSEKWELITTHTAVKTFITQAAKKGISIPVIAQIVGKDIQTIIDHYLGELSKEEIRSQMERTTFLKVS